MKLKEELKSRLPLLIFVILCALIVVHFAYEEISKPKAHETINVFITAQSCDNIQMSKKIEESLSVKTTVSIYAVDDKYYKESLQTSGLILADLLVLPQSLLPKNSIDKEFAPLKEDELKKFGILCENLVFYLKDNVGYAIKVYDAKLETNLLEQWVKFDGEEDYYILINLARPNAEPYSTAKNTTANAFAALAVLLAN